MSLAEIKNWVRKTGRRAVDWPFCSTSPDVRRIGDRDSGWVMHTQRAPVVCYCAGVGKGMSFELELAKITSRPVLVFDPSPTGIATVQASDCTNLKFFPIGLAAESRIVEFSLPLDLGEGSYSIAREGMDTVSFECWDLPTIMSRNGDSSIDLLKMDIEGFEYEIIDRFLEERIPIRQLCVEFHPWLRPGQTSRMIVRLYKAGYRIIQKSRGDYTFLIKDACYQKLLSSRVGAAA
jgi:FkbM family methyltransferase